MEKVIYIVGNPLVNEDAMPLKLAPKLRKSFPDIEFPEYDPTEDLPKDTKILVILDTVLGISKPQIFTDIDKIESQTTYSMHDFDLGWTIKLYKKLRMIEDVIIIGVPEKGDEEIILEEVKKIIKSSSLFSKNE